MSEHPYRKMDAPPPLVTRVRLLATMRLVDSVLIPAVILVGIELIAVFTVPARRHLQMLVVLCITLLALGLIVLRMLRPLTLEMPFPYRTLRWYRPGRSAGATEVPVADIQRVITVAHLDNDVLTYLVALEMNDGRRVMLLEDPNLAWGEGHAKHLAAKVESLLEQGARAAQGT